MWRKDLEVIVCMLNFTSRYQKHEYTKIRWIEREVRGIKRGRGKGKPVRY